MRGKVFAVPDRLKAFIMFFTTSLIIALIGLFVVPFIAMPPNSFAAKMYNTCCSNNFLFYLTPLLIMAVIVFGTILIVSVFSKKIIFTNNSIISKNVFTTRQLAFDEIKGFEVTRFALYIETNSKNKKRLSINLLSLERADNLIQNLEKQFINLDH